MNFLPLFNHLKLDIWKSFKCDVSFYLLDDYLWFCDHLSENKKMVTDNRDIQKP